MKTNFLRLLGISLLIFVIACEKSKYLDAIPDESLVVPQSLADFQAILDNDRHLNGNQLDGVVPSLGEAGTDDYFANNNLSAVGIGYTNLYKWDDNINSVQPNEWAFPYRCIYSANLVLDGLTKLTPTGSEQQAFNNVKGSALFFRSHAFYHLAQIFAPPYDKNSAQTDWGIALRLRGDINEKVQRATVQQTYDQIINDLKTSLPLLPLNPLYKTRPSKPAVFGLLAKLYLSMRDYENALINADSCLRYRNTLLIYSQIPPGAPTSFPFQRYNSEVIFSSVMILNTLIASGVARVDSILYKSYDSTDLRKTLFFRVQADGSSFRGSYDQSNRSFGGITVDEMYLIRAECNARKGNAVLATADLNTLLTTRWKTGTYIPYNTSDANAALQKILLERRKELVFRESRWIDLRRLNKDGANITITRKVGGQIYTLPPNSLHYTYLIPPDVMGFNPDWPQNPR